MSEVGTKSNGDDLAGIEARTFLTSLGVTDYVSGFVVQMNIYIKLKFSLPTDVMSVRLIDFCFWTAQ